jgi:hypothetical protein
MLSEIKSTQSWKFCKNKQIINLLIILHAYIILLYLIVGLRENLSTQLYVSQTLSRAIKLCP